jgi:hypothetical protein
LKQEANLLHAILFFFAPNFRALFSFSIAARAVAEGLGLYSMQQSSSKKDYCTHYAAGPGYRKLLQDCL